MSVAEENVQEVAVCPQCEGRGWVIDDDGGAGQARPCSCREADRVPHLLERARIPSRYKECRLRSFQVEVPEPDRQQLFRARAMAQRYVDEFIADGGRFRETGLLFVGPPGTGKTHLATAILRSLIERFHVRGLFVDFTTLVHDIQATFNNVSEDGKERLLQPVREAEVLVLDELGAQKPSPWVNDLLYLVMNSRYSERRATLFTTNFPLQEPPPIRSLDRASMPAATPTLADRIPERLVSRLFEMAEAVPIQAADFRREVKAARYRA